VNSALLTIADLRAISSARCPADLTETWFCDDGVLIAHVRQIESVALSLCRL